MDWKMPSERPFLLTTPVILTSTRHKLDAAREPQGSAFKRCEALSLQAAGMDLPVFNNTWFVGLKRADWERTWNDEWVYTWQVPGVLADPALGAALHFALTGSYVSLAAAKRVMNHALGFSFDASHFDVGLYYSFWCNPLLYAYDLIYHALTPLEREPIEAWFAAYYVAVRANDELWIKEILGGALNNHYAWHKWAIGTYGLHSGQPELVDYALNGPVGVTTMIEQGLRDDGLWLESSTAYNFSIHQPLTMLFWSLRNAGWPEDLFSKRFLGGRGLYDMYSAPLAWLFPDGSVPNVGDCYGEKGSLPITEYEYAYAAYHDPRFAWVLQKGTLSSSDFTTRLLVAQELVQPAPPEMTSRLWPEHGYALLTPTSESGYFSEHSAGCFISYGYSGIHGHQDKLSIELHASGQRWIVDAEASVSSGNAFLSEVERELGRSTLAHNTVMVDQHSQCSLKENAELEAFNTEERHIRIADHGLLYAGVVQERELRMGLYTLQDTFKVSSDIEHTYDYLLHLAAGAQVAFPLTLEPMADLGGERCYSWLRRVLAAPIDGTDLELTAVLGTQMLRLSFTVPSGSWLYSAESPRRDDYQAPSIPLVWIRYRGQTAAFYTRFCWMFDWQGG
jgi:hypothetical protein